ncbi:BTAD domain-containing putative transcriptional regulator [Iamia majanohamensis]|uniref:BTAD domain-containing putative transcriptional regulator n=1 Tax=Iamia majanohamensis TaxID=467976 RepID=A0AAE9YDV6_9ACTN|nr:AfsR/SARP family transcriptional regulator [Iamia majanohamensis]WCO67022.1 BTAD domain-containing putative transcriptional regulator [Iamia majanohamensis]
MSDLEVTVLGPVRARRGGEDLALGGPRQRAVLARLALAGGRSVVAERLVDELWDGDPPRSATNTLQSYVSNLRRALGGPVLARSGGGYRLDVDADALTSVRFERLVDEATRSAAPLGERLALLDEALGLWEGPALADVCDEPWARGDAARLEELRLTAVEARFDLRLEAGEHSVVVGALDAAAQEHPLRERLTAQLVLALHRCGRQPDALRAYERTRAHLAEALGLDPSPELARLAAQVLAHDPDLALPAAPLGRAPTVAERPAATDAPSTSAPQAPRPEIAPRRAPDGHLPLPLAVDERRARTEFVGRSDVLADLRRDWASVVDGSRRMAVVAGEPGMGKTRLAQQLAAEAHRDGAHVLWGRCTAEVLAPYQPVVEALRTAGRALGPDASRALVAAHPVVGLLVPDLAREDEARSPSEPASIERYALLEALLALLGDVSAARPVLLVVDDLQWADAATLSLVEHLLRSSDPGRLLLLATLRRPAGRATPDLDRALAEQRRDGTAEVHALAGLDADEVSTLLDHRGVRLDGEASEGLRRHTAGNPLFLEALAEQGDLAPGRVGALPDTVRDVLDQRLMALGDDALGVLGAAAIIGQRVDLGLLGHITDTSPDALLDVVDAAVDAGLLVEDEEVGSVTFPHALVRQALLSRTTRNREARLHLRIADALDVRPDWGDAPTRAQHLLAAGRLSPPDRTAAAALEAGRRALGARADQEAATWAQRASDLLAAADAPPPELLADVELLRATASRHLGRRADAEAAGARALEVARAHALPLVLAQAAQEAALLEAGVGFGFGSYDEALVARLDEALAALGDHHPAERAQLLAWASLARGGQDAHLVEARALAAEADGLSAELSGRPHVRALALLAQRIAHLGADGLDRRLALGAAMAEVGRGWAEMEVIGLCLDTVDRMEADDIAGSEQVAAQLRTTAAAYARPGFDAYVGVVDACQALVRGDLDLAARRSDEAVRDGVGSLGPSALHAWAGHQYLLSWERGEVTVHLDQVRSISEEFPTMGVWRAALAVCLVAAGDDAGARTAYAPLVAGRHLTLPTTSPGWYTTLSQLAEVAWLLDDVDACAAAAEALEPMADRVSVTGLGAASLGHLRRPFGLALAGAGDLDRGEQELARAAARMGEVGFRPWQARALAGRAAVLARRDGPGDAAEARRVRAEAEAVASEVGTHLDLRPAGATGPSDAVSA